MTKVSIKKNVKPKTIKQKQRQSQKQNVTVNIGTSAIKKRGRTTKKSQPVKQTQPISQPIIQSYNQPIFKQPSSLASSILASQPTAQPSSLASSILATQATPKVIAEEVKEQSTLRKALQEQITQVDEPVTKANDLERIRSERIKKFDKPVNEEIPSFEQYNIYKNYTRELMKQEEPIRRSLLSQFLAETQDDTEEIEVLKAQPKQPDIPFVIDLPSFRSTLTPLTQPTVELGFGGLSEEPIQTSVGQVLPPEPVSQNDLIIKGRNKKLPSLLKAVEPPPPITEPPETAPTILEGLEANEVRAADQYTTEQLVKDEPAGGAPFAESIVVGPTKTRGVQIEDKWKELSSLGLISSLRTEGGQNGPRRKVNDLLSEINGISGYESYEPIANKPGPKTVAIVI